MRNPALLLKLFLILFSLPIVIINCGEKMIDPASLDEVIHISVRSDPEGADVFFRIDSNVKEVKSINRSYLGTTPYSGTRTMRIPGLSSDNSNDVTLIIEVAKKGHYEVVERLNIQSVLSARSINLKFQLVPKS
jgi:hypothetical protein